MAKSFWFVVGLAAIGGGAYHYRDAIGPLLPPPVAAAIKSHTGIAMATVSEDKDARTAAPKAGASGAPPSKKGAAGAAPVTVATARLADMPVILAAPGTVEPLASVAIKPRVDGQVVEVGFKEGDLVQIGAVLYKLDDRLVRAQIKQAEAQIAKDQASLKDAMAIAERRESLFQKKYASEAATETAKQNVEVLKASIVAGQALLEAQRTQLDYLLIRAPITGRTGSMTAKLGAFVRSADPAALVTINQTKPIVVAFALPQASLQQLKTAMDTRAEAIVTVPGAKPITAKGVLSFVDNQIDKATGTVTGKVTVENADETLWPGQAVNVALTVETKRNLVSLPASAVLPAQQGMIVWVVNAEGRVAVRTVVQERVIAQTAFLASGISEGERVVTDGQLRLVPGAAVAIRDAPGAGSGSKGGGAKGPAAGGATAAPTKGAAGNAGGG